MNGLVAKVYMIQVNPETLLSLQQMLRGSATDSANLIVHLEELKPKLLKLKRNREIGKIADVVKHKRNEIEYVWFYL
jgi:hypothetical protein